MIDATCWSCLNGEHSNRPIRIASKYTTFDYVSQICIYLAIKRHQKLLFPGGYANGKKHGKGSFRDVDGNTYVGDWVEDKQHGKGKLTMKNGVYYEGDWQNNKRQGQGEEGSEDGNYFYSGQMVDGFRHGQGTMRYGQTHSMGIFRNGKLWTGKSISPGVISEYQDGVKRHWCCSNCSIQ